MTRPFRTVLVTLACALPLAWLAATATRGDAASTREAQAEAGLPAAPTPADVVVAELDGQAERLRQRLANAPAPRVPARDPFRYRLPDLPQTDPRAGFAVVAPARPHGRAVAPALASAVEPLRFVGLAEDTVEGVPVRRAILSGFDQLFIVGVGESVAGRYTVQAIGADAVELRDEAAGERLTLALR